MMILKVRSQSVEACACGSSSVCATVGEGSSSLVGMSARRIGQSRRHVCGERPQGSVDLFEGLRDQNFCVFGAGKSLSLALRGVCMPERHVALHELLVP